jgi:adenylate cyclase
MTDRPPLPRDARSVVDWLIDGARTEHTPQDVLAELCGRLVAGGLPLHRVAIFVRTLHPNVMGRRFVWRYGQAVQISERPHAMLEEDTYLASPIALIFRGQGTIRRRLIDPDCPNDFPIIEELRSEGVTDYLIQPLVFSNGEIHAVSWTTTRSEGFAEKHIAALEAIVSPFARVVEIYALRRTATTLLDTYVGRQAGERILQGRIRRGDIERIEAVIMLTDLRGFTTLSDQLPGHRVIGMLNSYFDCLVPPIERHGGEVLKFVGDGLLAIFAVAGDAGAACKAALATAREAQLGLAAAQVQRQQTGEPVQRYGTALHLGDVLYGNIGSTGRLDFTTVGPAVNLTARLETLARDLGRDLVVSAGFATHCPEALELLGSYQLRGFRDPQEVFAPATCAPSARGA